MALKRDQIPAPVLPKEAHEVPELGGEVIVRGLLLRERLALFDDAQGGERFGHLSAVLSACVIDADGQQIWTAEQWEQFGASHFEAALKLFNVAKRLSGLDAEERKKN